MNKLQKARENIGNPVELSNLFIDIGLDATEQNKSEQDIEAAINQAYGKGVDFAKVISNYVKKSRDDIKIDNDEI